MELDSSVTAASTAAMSSAFGGSGRYSFAPALIARTAAAASADPAGDDGNVDALRLEGQDQGADIEVDIDHDQVGASSAAQRVHAGRDIVDLRDLGAAGDGDLCGSRDLAAERADDEETHASAPGSGRALRRGPP
jgi:hypothetical protein